MPVMVKVKSSGSQVAAVGSGPRDHAAGPQSGSRPWATGHECNQSQAGTVWWVKDLGRAASLTRRDR